MSIKLVLTLLAFSGAAGILLGYVLRWLISLGQRGSLELEIKQRMLEAKERAAKVVSEAELRGAQIEQERLASIEERDDKLEKLEERLAKKEEFLDERERSIAGSVETLRSRENEAQRLKKEAEEALKERRAELARVARLSESAAKDLLMKDIESAHENAILARIQKLDAGGRERLEDKARSILTSVIHRLASNVNAEVTTLSVAIPSEEVKGKVIGKEGRVANALRHVVKAAATKTGARVTAEIITDDTPLIVESSEGEQTGEADDAGGSVG